MKKMHVVHHHLEEDLQEIAMLSAATATTDHPGLVHWSMTMSDAAAALGWRVWWMLWGIFGVS